MILLRPKVRMSQGPNRVYPEILFAIGVAEKIFENYGLSVNVESLLEGHSPQHYVGREVDMTVPEDQSRDIAADLQTALLDSFVVTAKGSIIHVVFTHA
jgi:hypothetical protein